MKKISIIKRFVGVADTKETTSYENSEWLANNNYITKQTPLQYRNVYVLGAFATGQDRKKPLSFISPNGETEDIFEFVKDTDEVITIGYDDFEKVYSKAESNLYDKYKLTNQSRIGVDYLIEVYEDGGWA